MTDFVLHPRLVTATFPLGDLPLCRVLLLNDHRYPWLLMIPRRVGIEEIVDLAPEDRGQLIEEMAQASSALRRCFDPFRLNIADIGNKAEQLHIHVVARNPGDPAWPAVVWSRTLEPYADAEAAGRVRDPLLEAFAEIAGFQRLDKHTDPGVERL